MLSKFVDEMKEMVLSRYFNFGNRRFLFWGANIYFSELMKELSDLGLAEMITAGLIDKDTTKQGKKIHGFEVLPPDKIGTLEFDTLVIMSDMFKEEIVLDFQQICNRIPDVIVAGTDHIRFKDTLFETIRKRTVGIDNAGSLDRGRIFQCLKFLALNNVSGNVIELGVAEGTTTCMIAGILKEMGVEKKIYGIDTFGGYPEKKLVLDLMHKTHPADEKYRRFTYDSVSKRCSDYPAIKLIQGEVGEALKKLSDEKFMLAFFDMNTYSGTREPLDFVYERTVPGGILCFDHYDIGGYAECLGQRIAIKEFLADKNRDLCLFMSNVMIKSPWAI